MEDGIRRNTYKYYMLCILIILLASSRVVLAATQGNIGQTSSSGSISITLHIPESTQLVALERKSVNLANADLCLHVIDTIARSRLNYYHIAVARLNNDSALENEETLAASIKQPQLMQLRNFYGEDAREQGACEQQQISLTQLQRDGVRPVLLMLIAE